MLIIQPQMLFRVMADASGDNQGMTLGGEYKWLVDVVQGMTPVEQKEQVFRGLAQEETFHPVGLFSSQDILYTGPPTFGPASAFDISQHHLTNVNVPGILPWHDINSKLTR